MRVILAAARCVALSTRGSRWRGGRRLAKLTRSRSCFASDAYLDSIRSVRTTIDIDAALLRRLKERKRREGKTLGQLVSELLASALQESERPGARERRLDWVSRPMGARVDLEDKEAVRRALEDR